MLLTDISQVLPEYKERPCLMVNLRVFQHARRHDTAPVRVPAVFHSRLELGPLSSHGRVLAQQVVLKVPQLDVLLSGRMFYTAMLAQDSAN